MEDISKYLREKKALGTLVGNSDAFLRSISHLAAMASSEASVLISGETGTGKELVARAVHYLSQRAASPFIAVNCGSLPDTLMESELFGHERGAFTDAFTRRQGLIAEAEGGTLFLDEVDALPNRAQVNLLRVLQDRFYRPLGSSREQRADVRVVAATNAVLPQLTQTGVFRSDLYYRLCVFSIELPPLRQRVSDIPLLARHFLDKHLPSEKQHLQLSRAAESALRQCEWPGNVRELENTIIRGIYLCRGPLIDTVDLGLSPLIPDSATPSTDLQDLRSMKRRVIEQFERSYLDRLMTQHNGNVSVAARAAGKERRDLGKLLKKYSFDIKRFRAPASPAS